MKKIQNRRRSKGFMLVEYGIVAALIAIGLYYAVTKLQDQNTQTKSQAVVSDLSSTIIPNTKRLYATQPSYTGVTINTLRDNNVFPSSWRNGTSVVGPFTGTISVAAATLVTAGDAIDMTIPNVPTQACSDIVRMLAGGIEQIAVGGTTVQAYQGTLNLATLGTQCAAAASSSIDLTFGKM